MIHGAGGDGTGHHTTAFNPLEIIYEIYDICDVLQRTTRWRQESTFSDRFQFPGEILYDIYENHAFARQHTYEHPECV